ncbi:PAS domain-containing protein [Hymenobacter sp. M29]|uniref:histidine kinase n=1 Tax=Hymenobacter mellowenesis TaxID=3063995 RepID=A0ABT9AFG7_9BACT|nr:PAS domain-containing protein [Hymenobacter sp. M29]MDO7848089.1 PAS domain-containing protein [Hymenobacter sp. M29]
MPDSFSAAPPAGLPASDGLLRTVLDVSLSAITLLHPIYAADGGEIVDFGLDYLSPAAQRLMGLSEQPGGSLRTRFPDTFANGVFGMYRQAFETKEPGQLTLHYQADGLDNFFQVAARRHGAQLVVSFLDAAEGPRTAMEDILRESQARERDARAEAERQRGELERVFEQAPLAIAVYRGPDYVIELANSTVARLWGRTRAQLMGKGLFEALPEVAGMGYEELLDGVMATGVPHVAHAMEAQHDRNGQRETVYWDFVYVPMYEADGSIYGAMVVATEVTEQVRARQQMQRLNEELELRVTARSAEARAAQHEAEEQREQARMQQALLGQILGQVPAAIATLHGPRHRFSFINERYQALVDGRAQLGQPVAEVLPEVVAQGFTDLLDGVYATGQPHIGLETPLDLLHPATRQPERRYLDFMYQPLADGKAQAQGILVFAHDVTDKVLARQEREARQAELQRIFEQAPVAIFVLRGPTYIVDVVNSAMSELLGPSLAELLDRPYFEVMPELASQGFPEFLAEVWRTGRPYRALEQPARLRRHQPHETGYFTFVYQPMRDARGRITGVMCVAVDVTEQVRARQQVQDLNEELAAINAGVKATNEELQDTNTRLTRTNADLDTFVYTASHDLKAPIANIEGLLLALRYDLPPAVLHGGLVPRLLDMMQGSVTRFQQTIGHLTNISQLQRAEATETVDLPDLIGGVQLDLNPLIEAAAATLTVDVADCHTVRVAPKTLRSVVYNLLSNALKYRAPDRPAQVALRARCTPGQLVLEVQDNGLGLSEVQQGQLFGMFRRLHTHVEGSGVGLFMVKRLIENAGGTIEVQSVPDVGSTFRVVLPA